MHWIIRKTVPVDFPSNMTALLKKLHLWFCTRIAPSLDKKTRHVILKPTFWPPGPLSMFPGRNQSSLSAQQQPRVTAKTCCGYRQFLSEGVLLQQCWTWPPTGTLLSSEQHYLVVCVQVFFSWHVQSAWQDTSLCPRNIYIWKQNLVRSSGLFIISSKQTTLKPGSTIITTLWIIYSYNKVFNKEMN